MVGALACRPSSRTSPDVTPAHHSQTRCGAALHFRGGARQPAPQAPASQQAVGLEGGALAQQVDHLQQPGARSCNMSGCAGTGGQLSKRVPGMRVESSTACPDGSTPRRTPPTCLLPRAVLSSGLHVDWAHTCSRLSISAAGGGRCASLCRSACRTSGGCHLLLCGGDAGATRPRHHRAGRARSRTAGRLLQVSDAGSCCRCVGRHRLAGRLARLHGGKQGRWRRHLGGGRALGWACHSSRLPAGGV